MEREPPPRRKKRQTVQSLLVLCLTSQATVKEGAAAAVAVYSTSMVEQLWDLGLPSNVTRGKAENQAECNKSTLLLKSTAAPMSIQSIL